MVSEKLLLTIAENSVLMDDLFHGVARKFGLYTCVHPVTKNSLLMGLVQNFFASLVSTKAQAVSTEFSIIDSMKLGPAQISAFVKQSASSGTLHVYFRTNFLGT